jgi:hypothetical protein
MIFWVITQCSLVDGHKLFVETYRPYLEGGTLVSSNRWYPTTKVRDIGTQDHNILSRDLVNRRGLD